MYDQTNDKIVQKLIDELIWRSEWEKITSLSYRVPINSACQITINLQDLPGMGNNNKIPVTATPFWQLNLSTLSLGTGNIRIRNDISDNSPAIEDAIKSTIISFLLQEAGSRPGFFKGILSSNAVISVTKDMVMKFSYALTNKLTEEFKAWVGRDDLQMGDRFFPNKGMGHQVLCKEEINGIIYYLLDNPSPYQYSNHNSLLVVNQSTGCIIPEAMDPDLLHKMHMLYKERVSMFK